MEPALTGRRLGQRDPRRISPELFQLIERARPLIHQMHDEIPIIHEDPLWVPREASCRRGRLSLDVPHRASPRRQDGVDVVREGVDLPAAACGADHEEIGHAGEGTQIDNHNVLGLFLQGRMGSRQRIRLAVDRPPLWC